jgi:tetratricopeptide (TPR) repeat protein
MICSGEGRSIMFAFARDDRVAELLRQATAFKDKKEWDKALSVLAEAKKLMLVSPVAYSIETWCKYPLYLQQAGRFEEAMEEFKFLFDDLERRARHEAKLDNPNVSSERRKIAYYQIIISNGKQIIKDKMTLAQSRQKKLKVGYL